MHIQLSIATREAFYPAKSELCFRAIVSDFVNIILIQRIVERLARLSLFSNLCAEPKLWTSQT